MLQPRFDDCFQQSAAPRAMADTRAVPKHNFIPRLGGAHPLDQGSAIAKMQHQRSHLENAFQIHISDTKRRVGMSLGGGDHLLINKNHFINHRTRRIALFDQTPRCVAHLLPLRGVFQ
jgi:hypothetical protein